MRMNQVSLPVDDMPAATRFYRRLGFLQIVDTAHYARFECDAGATFSLMLSERPIDNGAILYFEDDDLDARVAALAARGIAFEQWPTDMSYLWREAVLRDPAGNCIKLYQAGRNRRFPPWRVMRRDEDI